MPTRPISLRWIASVSASCLHAAEAIARGKSLADPRLAQAVAGPATALRDVLRGAALPEYRFWRQLMSLSHQIESDRELAAVTLRKTVGAGRFAEPLVLRIAERIAALEASVRQAVPGIVDELDLRSRPLRELWEARGPGLLHAVGQRTEPGLLVESAEVVLVLPALGGGGAAHLANNSVRIEAVLTNNIPQLPEVLRLGWLLAQLHCDLPAYSESVAPDRLPLLGQLALIPPILHAAAEVELAEFHPQQVAAALDAWHPDCNPTPETGDTLIAWWETYEATRPAWRTALAALDRMTADLITPAAGPGP